MNSTPVNNAKHRRRELIYCPMCTHVVEGYATQAGKKLVVDAGQECQRCHSALDAGYIIRRDRAA
jgi:hypothetical protein